MEKINIKEAGKVTVVAIIGDIEFDDALEINETIKKVIDKGHFNLIFNLKDCSYIDSSGLGALVETMKECQRLQGDLRLCHLNNDFKDVLTMTRTIKYFQIFADEKSALQSFSAL